MRTIVYVDGFNLYYGALRRTPHRWLDLEALCSRLLACDHIVRIRYFTARVKSRPSDPQGAIKQQTYLRALGTSPLVSIHLGHFLESRVRMPLVSPPPNTVEVVKTEEKGSDVNLAAHLLLDAFRARFERAVLITNDSDLKTPVEMVRQELGAPVGILNPHRRRSWALSPKQLPPGSFYRPIRAAALASSQFPAVLTDGVGQFRKPHGW